MASTTYDTGQLLEEWRINGFVVFEDIIPEETIDRIREAWIPIREQDVTNQGPLPSRGEGRYSVRVPFEQPFVDPEIFEHPRLVEFLEEVLGDDYVWAHFDSNIPLPSCGDYQNWHRDCPPLFPGLMTPAYDVGVKFPLVDTSEENGSIEVMPGTQYVTGIEPHWNQDHIFGNGAEPRGRYSSSRLNLKKGSVWVQDPRVFHRGTPNYSDVPRDELCMGMSQSWYFSQWQHEYIEPHFPRDLWESLSDHARQVLRWQRVKD